MHLHIHPYPYTSIFILYVLKYLRDWKPYNAYTYTDCYFIITDENIYGLTTNHTAT